MHEYIDYTKTKPLGCSENLLPSDWILSGIYLIKKTLQIKRKQLAKWWPTATKAESIGFASHFHLVNNNETAITAIGIHNNVIC